MRFHALFYALGALTFPMSQGYSRLGPCPEGRTLKRQIEAAEAVVLGKVTFERDCRPPSAEPGQRPFVDCLGRRAYVSVTQTWKGPLSAGDSLALRRPARNDSASLILKKGETRVVFATKLYRVNNGSQWLGETDACRLPEGIKSDKQLRKQLDAWQQAQKAKKP